MRGAVRRTPKTSRPCSNRSEFTRLQIYGCAQQREQCRTLTTTLRRNFSAKVRTGRRIHYRRFDTAAEAIRFAIEELPAPSLAGAYLQVEDERFAGEEIRELFESAA